MANYSRFERQIKASGAPICSTRTNSLLAKVLTIASSFFVPFVAESQGVTVMSQTVEEPK